MFRVKLLKRGASIIYTQSRRANRKNAMIDHLDHLVLTTAKEAACIDFYIRVLGMQLESFIGGTPPVERKAFRFGNQKINLHIKGKEFEPKADIPTPGSLDLCFISDRPLSAVISKLSQAQWPMSDIGFPFLGRMPYMAKRYLSQLSKHDYYSSYAYKFNDSHHWRYRLIWAKFC